MLKALGTPETDKSHVTFPAGHVDIVDRMEIINVLWTGWIVIWVR